MPLEKYPESHSISYSQLADVSILTDCGTFLPLVIGTAVQVFEVLRHSLADFAPPEEVVPEEQSAGCAVPPVQYLFAGQDTHEPLERYFPASQLVTAVVTVMSIVEVMTSHFVFAPVPLFSYPLLHFIFSDFVQAQVAVPVTVAESGAQVPPVNPVLFPHEELSWTQVAVKPVPFILYPELQFKLASFV